MQDFSISTHSSDNTSQLLLQLEQVKEHFRQKCLLIEDLEFQLHQIKSDLEQRDATLASIRSEFEERCGYSLDSWFKFNLTIDQLRSDLDRANSRSYDDWVKKDQCIDQLRADIQTAETHFANEMASKQAELENISADLSEVRFVHMKSFHSLHPLKANKMNLGASWIIILRL